MDRGTPIDRVYIEVFLHERRGDITGHVLEIGSDYYTKKFGQGASAVTVLHYNDPSPPVTIIGDLTTGIPELSDASVDCVLCIQTLHEIYDVQAALRTIHRLLTPGGVLLATGPGITQACNPERHDWGDFWRFTSLSLHRLTANLFGSEQVSIRTYGNVLAATAFLHGVAAEEVRRETLDFYDPNYELLVAVRAVKTLTA
jgi:SAM-dependent methyltransferase